MASTQTQAVAPVVPQQQIDESVNLKLKIKELNESLNDKIKNIDALNKSNSDFKNEINRFLHTFKRQVFFFNFYEINFKQKIKCFVLND